MDEELRTKAEEKKRIHEENIARRTEKELEIAAEKASIDKQENEEIMELLQEIDAKIKSFREIMIPLRQHMIDPVPFYQDKSIRSTTIYSICATQDKQVEISISGSAAGGRSNIKTIISGLESNSSKINLLRQFLQRFPVFERYYVDNMDSKRYRV